MRILLLISILLGSPSVFAGDVPDSITVCNRSYAVEYVLNVKNTKEYHLGNGIIVIRSFHPNGSIASESYWVNRIDPVIQTKKYDEEGKLKATIDHSHGKFDLCYLIQSGKADGYLSRDDAYIALIPSDAETTVDVWSVSYSIDEATSYYMTMNTVTGDIQHHEDFILVQPIYDDITDEMKPTYTGGINALQEFFGNHIFLPYDSIVNARVLVGFKVDTHGKVSDIHIIKGHSSTLDNEALKVVELMPEWNAASDTSTIKKIDYVMPMFFRKLD